MRPSVFCFPLSLLISIRQGQGALRWQVEDKLTHYGQTLVLMCKVPNCCFEAAGWYLWNPDKRTIFKDVKTTNISTPPKYLGGVRTDGFTLFITNLTQTDIHVNYSCDYGSLFGDSILLHKDNVFKNDQSKLEFSTTLIVTIGVVGSILFIVLIAVVIIIIRRKQTRVEEVELSKLGKEEGIGRKKCTIYNDYCSKIEVSFKSSRQQKQTDTSLVNTKNFKLYQKRTVKIMQNAEIESGKSYTALLEKEFIDCNVHVKYTYYYLGMVPSLWYSHTELQHNGTHEMVFTVNGVLDYKSGTGDDAKTLS
ncbi:uncharacterized protein LOC127732159 [Mytilus californianus]|uniref:uncharacterized protein LOC127732159 n=1 Tax=Mytilus californianus TaxID=6549 RepID=UPI002247DB7D|nr:uncharacterized protein LOC127732159 [Mytilus californianus]